MSAASRYPIPARIHRVETTIQRSRFITTLAPAPTVDDAVAFIRRIGAEFADATHNCWAYVVGPPGSTGRIGSSDDGEPHGTAGRPILGALLHGGVGDVAAVVTRYYGGTKLGTGGLVRAYGGCAQEALATLPRTERVERVALRIGIDYTRIAAVQQLLPVFEVEVLDDAYGEDVAYEVRLPVEQVEAFQAALRDATRGQARIETMRDA